MNVATSVDGKIDTFERRGAPISDDADRQRVDALRAASDAVMVGGRTLREEDPRLTVKSDALRAERRARGLTEQPAKVGIVSGLPLLRPNARFLTAGPARIILFSGGGSTDADADLTAVVSNPSQPQTQQLEIEAALRLQGVEVYTTPMQAHPAKPSGGSVLTEPPPGARVPEASMRASRVDLSAAMDKLLELGIERLLVEGGASLNFELLRLGLVDEVLVYIAPLIFGGATAPTLADGVGLRRELALKLRRTQFDAQADGGVLLRYKVDPT